VPGDPREFSGIAMMGGPMSVNDELPWIAPLSRLLRAAVGREVPVIGHCLGGQLFAQALGAPVTRAKVAEIGWLDVDVCSRAARQEWFGGRTAFNTFQWHYDAFALPAGATPVLTNAFNANQAFVVDDRHIGLQCHVEMTRALTETWLASGSDELPSASTPATQTASEIRRDLDARIDALHAVANDIYARWAQGLRRT
jgi:GMP synthase-like glutamine amidotransferase